MNSFESIEFSFDRNPCRTLLDEFVDPSAVSDSTSLNQYYALVRETFKLKDFIDNLSNSLAIGELISSSNFYYVLFSCITAVALSISDVHAFEDHDEDMISLIRKVGVNNTISSEQIERIKGKHPDLDFLLDKLEGLGIIKKNSKGMIIISRRVLAGMSVRH